MEDIHENSEGVSMSETEYLAHLSWYIDQVGLMLPDTRLKEFYRSALSVFVTSAPLSVPRGTPMSQKGPKRWGCVVDGNGRVAIDRLFPNVFQARAVTSAGMTALKCSKTRLVEIVRSELEKDESCTDETVRWDLLESFELIAGHHKRHAEWKTAELARRARRADRKKRVKERIRTNDQHDTCKERLRIWTQTEK